MRLLNATYYWLLSLLLLSLCACHNSAATKAVPEEEQAPATPVTVTSISTDALAEYVDLNATATFMQKSYVKANVNGYIQSQDVVLGKYVSAGQTLFVVKTKEAQSIGNAVNKLDGDFKFSGINNIKATANGYITLLNHQPGDYVQDGEQLAVISDKNSFAFLLNLPYELKGYMSGNNTLELTLPDGTVLKGTVSASMPSVDPGAQTQSIVIKVATSTEIPENLIAKVRINKINKVGTVSLPKAAVLSNDVQSDFWIMQVTDSNTAVKVPVKKGIETKDRVEILEPKLNAGDKILLTGNYGLPDTAKITIVH